MLYQGANQIVLKNEMTCSKVYLYSIAVVCSEHFIHDRIILHGGRKSVKHYFAGETYFVLRSFTYNAHAVSKRPNTKLIFERSFWTGQFC